MSRFLIGPLALALLSCTSPARPALELALHDQPVTCVEGAALCTLEGQPAAAEEHRVRVRLGRSSRASRSDPGLHLETQLVRAGGVLGMLQIDLPPATVAAPLVLYSETDRAGRLLFKTSRVAGRIELSRDADCPCQTGRLELLFTDAGPDGVLGSADDQVRRFTRARLRQDGRPFCHRRSSLTLREGLLVVGRRTCPVARFRGGGGGGGSAAWTCTGSLALDWNDGWYDEEWTGDWSEEEWVDGGPEESWAEDWSDPAFTDPAPGGDWEDAGAESSGDEGWDEAGSDLWGDDEWTDSGSDWEDEDWGSEDWGSGDWSSDDGGSEDWGSEDWGSDDWGDDSGDGGDDDWWDDP